MIAGLMGKSNVDAMMIDMIQLTREDLLTQEAKMMFEKDEAAKVAFNCVCNRK